MAERFSGWFYAAATSISIDSGAPPLAARIAAIILTAISAGVWNGILQPAPSPRFSRTPAKYAGPPPAVAYQTGSLDDDTIKVECPSFFLRFC
ncbi:MAG: hypothetical protein NWS01_05070 [Burkholderiales bacterium]|nr:hypothetical protein [Burkholderiales bacterium]